jgi:type II secretion system protein J
MAGNLHLQREGKDLRGFTLLEVLVSVAILALLLAALSRAYVTNVEAIQIARENGQVHQTARIVLDMMTRDLQSALTELGVTPETTRLGLIGKNQERDGRRIDRIDFTTLTHMALTEQGPSTDLCEVGYMVVEDEEEDEILVLMRRDDASPDEDFAEGGAVQELTRDILEFKMTYEDSRGEEHDDWGTEEGGETSGLPVLIRVRLVLKDSLNREHVFTTSIHPELAGTKNQ